MDKVIGDQIIPPDAPTGACTPKRTRPTKGLSEVKKKQKPTKKNEKSLDEQLSAIAAAYPEEELKKFPKDLSINFEHYMYGAAKQ
jgi:hypothetical protein